MRRAVSSKPFFNFFASFLIMTSGGENTNSIEIDTSEFLAKTASGNYEEINVEGNRINLKLEDGTSQHFFKEPGVSVYELLESSGIEKENISNLPIKIIDTSGEAFWSSLLINVLPIVGIIFFIFLMVRSAQSNSNSALSFGKSRAKLYEGKKQKTTFDDVAGADEAKEELVEVVDFLKKPEKYKKVGAKIPKGVMLVGQPGTGKTLLARAVAGEANVPFFNISGSEFVEMFVGVGASRVRDLFKKAKRNAPCIIFIDEIDAVGRHRGAGMGGGHDEREQTLNQILTEMDGFETGTNVIVIAATNRPDILDPALLRPGRFDRRIVVDMPDKKARTKILEVHGRNKPLDSKVNLEDIAKSTPGFAGADLENLMNEAAILTAREDKKKVTQDHLVRSIEKVLMGPARKSKVMNEKERRITAYHEVGHALVGHMLPGCDPVHKVSIVSRGMALGVTWFLPQEDRVLVTKSKFLDELCSLMGGYTAEIVFFGEMTTGASNDLEKATKIARNMVTRYGMSKLGPVSLTDGKHEVFLGKDYGHVKTYSEASAREIDEIIQSYLQAAFEKTKKIIEKHKGLMKTIAEDLLKKENIDKDEFAQYFKKAKIKAPKKD
jgi:cell division protease FtsH